MDKINYIHQQINKNLKDIPYLKENKQKGRKLSRYNFDFKDNYEDAFKYFEGINELDRYDYYLGNIIGFKKDVKSMNTFEHKLLFNKKYIGSYLNIKIGKSTYIYLIQGIGDLNTNKVNMVLINMFKEGIGYYDEAINMKENYINVINEKLESGAINSLFSSFSIFLGEDYTEYKTLKEPVKMSIYHVNEKSKFKNLISDLYDVSIYSNRYLMQNSCPTLPYLRIDKNNNYKNASIRVQLTEEILNALSKYNELVFYIGRDNENINRYYKTKLTINEHKNIILDIYNKDTSKINESFEITLRDDGTYYVPNLLNNYYVNIPILKILSYTLGLSKYDAFNNFYVKKDLLNNYDYNNHYYSNLIDNKNIFYSIYKSTIYYNNYFFNVNNIDNKNQIIEIEDKHLIYYKNNNVSYISNVSNIQITKISNNLEGIIVKSNLAYYDVIVDVFQYCSKINNYTIIKDEDDKDIIEILVELSINNIPKIIFNK